MGGGTVSLEGHFCWENCDEGPHGCVCGNDCPNPQGDPVSAADETREAIDRLESWLDSMLGDVLIYPADVRTLIGASRKVEGEVEWVYSIGFPDEDGLWYTDDAGIYSDHESAKAELDTGNWLDSDRVVRCRKAGPWEVAP